MLRIEKVERLIDSGRLSDALDHLIPVCKSKDEPRNQVYKLINHIIERALERDDVGLAAKAAAHATGFSRFDDPRPEASWNAIIHQAIKSGGLPKLDMDAKFLSPNNYGPAPNELHKLAVELWQYGKDHHWDIPGCEVVFDAYSNGCWSQRQVLAMQVSEIRGKDFVVSYRGVQGLVDVKDVYDLNDVGNFSGICAPNFVLQFYEDDSGPSCSQYAGTKDWADVVLSLDSYSSHMHINHPEWKEIDCEVPAYNRVFIEHLFNPRKNQEAIMEKRKTGAENKQEYTERATKFLRDEVMARLRGDCYRPR